MPTAYRTIGLTAKIHMENKDAVLRPVLEALTASGATVVVDPHTVGDVPCVAGNPRIGDSAPLDLVVAVGGDGTILRTLRELRPRGIPLVAINAGSVGFLSEMTLAEVPERLPALLAGGGAIERRSTLETSVLRAGEPAFSCSALNDVVISQGTISRLLDLDAAVDGQFLATYRADGLIVATPTGSTAYSLAAGGPVVHPVVPGIILTPINPHGFTQKPIVLPGTSLVDVSIAGAGPSFENATVGVTVDGQVYHELAPGDRVSARTGPDALFLRARDDAFYRALREKLKWGESLED
jgi:NAD+ kinase